MRVDPIGVAVLGMGRIGSMHAELLAHRVRGVRLVTVYDVRPDATQGYPAAESLEAALAEPAVDAVAVCTSTETHADVIEAAAAAGKHVFCEKPLSLDLAEVDRSVAAVEAAGLKLQVGFNRRFDASHRAVAEAVRSGRIGAPELCRISSRDPAPPPIEYIESSGGIFLDMTVHDFDMARFVTGSEVVEVYARGRVAVDPAIGAAGDVDTAVTVLTHENGCLTTIDNSRRAVYGYDQRVEVFGATGKAMSANQPVHSTTVHTAEGYTGAEFEYFFLDRYIPSYLAQWDSFVSALEHGTEPTVTGADGRAPLLIGLAALRSLDERRPVAVAEIAG